MTTKDFLLKLHTRTHKSFEGLLKHCRKFSEEQINREMDGFGIPTIRLSLHHMIEAEKYWVGVIEGRIDVDENADEFPTIESLEKYRAQVFELTHNHIKNSTDEQLDTARKMMTWQNKEYDLAPVHIITRTQTHIYQHQGQVLAICRLFGEPCSGLDYPIKQD